MLATTYSTTGTTSADMAQAFHVFQMYWTGYVRAVTAHDFETLKEAATGAALKETTDLVARDKALGQQRRLEVVQQLPPVITLTSDPRLRAEVGDNTTTHEQIINAQGQVTSDVQRALFRVRLLVRQEDGTWRVTGTQTTL